MQMLALPPSIATKEKLAFQETIPCDGSFDVFSSHKTALTTTSKAFSLFSLQPGCSLCLLLSQWKFSMAAATTRKADNLSLHGYRIGICPLRVWLWKRLFDQCWGDSSAPCCPSKIWIQICRAWQASVARRLCNQIVINCRQHQRVQSSVTVRLRKQYHHIEL